MTPKAEEGSELHALTVRLRELVGLPADYMGPITIHYDGSGAAKTYEANVRGRIERPALAGRPGEE